MAENWEPAVAWRESSFSAIPPSQVAAGLLSLLRRARARKTATADSLA